MTQESQVNKDKSESFESRVFEMDRLLSEYVTQIGAKSHDIEIVHNVVFGIALPVRFSIDIQFEDGRKYGFSENSFSKCFNEIKKFIGDGKRKA